MMEHPGSGDYFSTRRILYINFSRTFHAIVSVNVLTLMYKLFMDHTFYVEKERVARHVPRDEVLLISDADVKTIRIRLGFGALPSHAFSI